MAEPELLKFAGQYSFAVTTKSLEGLSRGEAKAYINGVAKFALEKVKEKMIADTEEYISTLPRIRRRYIK